MKTRINYSTLCTYGLLLLNLFVISNSEENIPKDGTKRLTMVHAFWRHGDRSPEMTFSKDPIREDSWKEGGGGWGEVTTRGMEQLMNLGGRLRERYVESGFLSPYYNSRELYIYSSPFNRTIVSALACMVGMYSQGTQPMIQIPHSSKENKIKWPENYVPIPIHSFTLETDHTALPDGPCPRQTILKKMTRETPEFIAFTKENETMAVLQFLQDHMGPNFTYDGLERMYDAFFIELYNKMNDKMWKLWTPELHDKMRILSDRLHDFLDALGVAPYEGIDLNTELAKIRIGTYINDMVDKMVLKEKCNGRTDSHCEWYTKLKFHGVSGHDSTMFSYFSAIGVKKRLLPRGGWPLYVSCILTETWKDDVTGQLYVKLVYTPSDGEPFEVATSSIRGCESSGDYCPLEIFQGLAEKIRPDVPILQLVYTPTDGEPFEVATNSIRESWGDYCPLEIFQGLAEKIRPDVPILQHCLNDSIISIKGASSMGNTFSSLFLVLLMNLIQM